MQKLSRILKTDFTENLKKKMISFGHCANFAFEKKVREINYDFFFFCRKHTQFVIDSNGPDDYCPVCNQHLDDPSNLAHVESENSDRSSVICLTNCQHKVHLACLKWSTPDMALCLKCPTCASISGAYIILHFFIRSTFLRRKKNNIFFAFNFTIFSICFNFP